MEKMNGRNLLGAALSVVMLAGCEPEDKDRIVAARGYDAPKEWAPIPVMGRTLYMNGGFGPLQKLADAHPELEMFHHPWMEIQFEYRPDEWRYIDRRVRDYKPQNASPWTNFPSRITDVLAKSKIRRGWMEDFEKRYPDHPFSIVFWGARPHAVHSTSYDTDTEDFAKWRAAHPAFHSFVAFDEYDGDQSGLKWQIDKVGDPVRRAFLRQQYPAEPAPEVFRRWTDLDYRKAVAFHWGCTDFYGLWSSGLSYGHDIARKGLKFLFYEAEHGSTASPWRWGGMYARGASRQFATPFGWYGAMFTNNTRTRDGRKVDGMNGINLSAQGFVKWPNPDNRNVVKHLGSSRSLLRRNMTYGYLIGSIRQCVEGGNGCFGAIGEDGRSWEPSVYALDQERIFRWNNRRDRGVSYAPVAFLPSLYEEYQRQGYNKYNRDKASISAFLHTLVPTPGVNHDTYCLPEKGFEGNLWNSEFGELCDVICPDCGQPTDTLAGVLRPYKAAFLIGHHSQEHCDKEALRRYVDGGGTLFCSYDQVTDGFVSAGMAGVAFGAEKTPCGAKLLDEKGRQVGTFTGDFQKYSFAKGTPNGAVPFLTDENGTVVVWANRYGRGRVVTVAAGRMLPDDLYPLKISWWNDARASNAIASGARTFPIIHALLRRVQDETMPIAVDGDIQWGLNKVKRKKEKGKSDGWLLWLINNKGVKKFALEPEEIDLAQTATVTVDLKGLKGADVFDITDLERDVPIEVRGGKFTVTVKPGEDREIAIER